MSFSQGAKWKALINKYIGTIPFSGDGCRAAEQSMSGMSAPWIPVSSAMTAKVGAAARDSHAAATRTGDSRLFPNACRRPAGREAMKISDTVVSQRLPVPKSSEYPAFSRDHWTMGRPSMR